MTSDPGAFLFLQAAMISREPDYQWRGAKKVVGITPAIWRGIPKIDFEGTKSMIRRRMPGLPTKKDINRVAPRNTAT